MQDLSQRNPSVELSIVLPCLNEAETIERCVLEGLRALSAAGIAGEVIVADNGSSDGSAEIAARCGAIVVPVAERGYGAALLGGFAAARGQFILMADADLSYDLGELPRFITALRGGAELVMGTRFPRGGGRIEPGAMPTLHRHLGTPVLTALTRLFFGARIGDINCGMRAFHRDALRRMDLRMTGMELASEIVLKAATLRQRIVEVPVTLRKDGRSRPPHLHTWRDGWRHLRMLLLFSPRWLFVAPGLILTIGGAVALAVLSVGNMRIGDVTFSTNSMLVAAMTLILGTQMLLMGVFAKTFVVAERLLPGSRLDRVGSALTLEAGIGAGAFLALAGIVLVGTAVGIWRRNGFGPLDGHIATRLVVLGVTLVILGVQLGWSAFFLGVLALPRRGGKTPS